jgi:hypothetical protein
MRRLELVALLASTQQSVAWSRERGLIPWHATCPVCSSQMVEARHKGIDGVIWNCTRRIDGLRHFKRVSIREGTIFSKSKLPLSTLILLLYEWSRNTKPMDAVFELDLHERTVLQWYELCRNVCSLATLTWRNAQLGGPGATIEIDECQLGRRKAHQGRVPTAIWVFGGIVRNSDLKDLFIEIVPNRSRDTLEPIIVRKIHPECRIVSDSWSGYRHLSSAGFNHSQVNHSRNFVDPSDSSTHTQGVENLWRQLRRFLHAKGTNYRRHLKGYIAEFIYKRLFENLFESIIEHIAEFQRRNLIVMPPTIDNNE